jgi:hypothetical protein
MPKKRAEAEALVAASADGRGVSADYRERIVGALTEDLRAAADAASILENRLLNIEAKLRVLTEAASRTKDE